MPTSAAAAPHLMRLRSAGAAPPTTANTHPTKKLVMSAVASAALPRLTTKPPPSAPSPSAAALVASVKPSRPLPPPSTVALPASSLQPPLTASKPSPVPLPRLTFYSDVARVIATSPSVADLLISLLYSAVAGRRMPFAPPLDVFAPLGDGRFFRVAETDVVDFAALHAAVQLLPSVADMQALIQQGGHSFADTMDGLDTRLLPLLRWLFHSAPSIRQLTAAELLPSISSPLQFLIAHSNEAEERFQGKRGKGSVWAFHGSRGDSWHCILRTGLKNLRSDSPTWRVSSMLTHFDPPSFIPQLIHRGALCSPRCLPQHDRMETASAPHAGQ